MTNNILLQIRNLHARVPEKEIIKGLNLQIKAGEVHAIMGPNGAGKSTLSYVLTGKKDYEVTEGEILFDGADLLALTPAERAASGLFLSMQSPVAIPGVTTANFLKYALNAKRKFYHQAELDNAEFMKLLRTEAAKLDIGAEMLKREINVGFSGGEKKRLEILQMRLLEPKLTILDEADSGLDIDALKLVADGVNNWHNAENSLLVITHHIDLLNNIKPNFVHIYADGRIIRSGDMELAKELEKSGYKNFMEAK